MKKTLTTIFMLGTLLVSAQNDTATVENHQFKANLLFTPSLDYEMGVTQNTTLGIQLGTELLYVENSITNETEFSGLFPSLDVYYRYYYNFKRRAAKEKNTHNNSANYFGITTTYVLSEPIIKSGAKPDDNYVFALGAVYGLQRTYWKRLNLGVEGGIGYSFSDFKEEVIPVLNFNLGWVFGK